MAAIPKAWMPMGLPGQEFDPYKLFWSAFGIASFAGLAALLRSGKRVTITAVMSAMLNTGLMGLAIALLWYTKFADEKNLYFLIGVCLLAGLGGTTLMDFVFHLCKKGGFSIVIKQDDDPPALPESNDRSKPAQPTRPRGPRKHGE